MYFKFLAIFQTFSAFATLHGTRANYIMLHFTDLMAFCQFLPDAASKL